MRFIGSMAVGLWLAGMCQAAAYKAPRAADGKPNLNGIWQTLNSANWDIQGHAAQSGPVVALGAAGAVPAGLGVVEAMRFLTSLRRPGRKRRTLRTG